MTGRLDEPHDSHSLAILQSRHRQDRQRNSHPHSRRDLRQSASHHSLKSLLSNERTPQVKILSSITIDKVDLGKRPMKLGGIKAYETREDEVIMEAPVLWGSSADVSRVP